MKKINLSILAILLIFIMDAQEKKLSIGIIGSPDIYNYQFDSISGFDHKFNAKANYSVGLRLQYSFTEKIGVISGFQYSTKGYTLHYSWIVADPNDPALPVKTDLHASYLDIPLMVTSNFIIRNKISLFTSAGVVAGFFVSSRETSVMPNGSKKETRFLKLFYNPELNSPLLALQLEFAVKYNLNEKLFLSLSPYFRYGFNKISDDLLISPPTSYGAILGFHFNLK